MKHRYIILYLILLASSLFSQKYLAILDIEPMGIANTDAKILTERLTTVMIDLSDHIILERTKIKKILDEQKFQHSGCTDSECAVEIGRLLNADYTIVGTVSKIGETFTLDCRIINVESGEALVSASFTHEGKIDKLVKEGIKSIAQNLIKKLKDFGLSQMRKTKPNHTTSSTIQGNITDLQTNQVLLGANIILMETMLGSASDENGNYLIINVPIGNYSLKAMFIGYEIYEKEIRIEGNQTYTIDIQLVPSAIELQETRVTAEKRKEKVTEAPASIEIITSRDIKRESTTNIGSYLKGLKGVDFTSSGINNYSISIRGFNSSFNTRVLTLTDGRVANIPALRVINYSAVPQSMDDIDRMEVILGPATALFGANAHSGVVNIISKPPAQSEGLTMSVSGSNDDRQLRKINGRWAKKLSDSFSIKLSGMYLHAYEWPYISETEYKSHLYPWAGNPYRQYDGKDNNPWKDSASGAIMDSTNDGRYVMIGDGDPNDTGDPDGDGVQGEDWFNGYDDDGDGLIDEDYFEDNGKDDGGLIICTEDTNEDGCICCEGDYGVDENIDSGFDVWTDGYDNDGNGDIDDGREMFTNNSGTNYDPEWAYNLDEKNIIVKGGRGVENVHGEPNLWYVEGATLIYADLRGDHYFDSEKIEYVFDIYIYDWGADGIPGDPYEDTPGDGKFQPGEGAPWEFFGGTWLWTDYGLDGDPNTNDPGENDGIWQPGDCWVDDGNGIIDQIGFGGTPDGYDGNCNADNNDDLYDLYPIKNGQFDSDREVITGDWGNDGIEGTGDPGENDGLLIAWDSGENDGYFDKGDGNFAFKGEDFFDCGILTSTGETICEGHEQWTDGLGNGRWDTGEEFTDINGDNLYTPPDYVDEFQFVSDVNGDGLSDYPDFEVENKKAEFRIDFDPSHDFNITLQGGYSWTKTQQVTGTSRYLADGFEYEYYQLRGRFYNWYSQIYVNQSFSGNTRSYNQGNVIEDRSKNYAFQIQRNDKLSNLNTELVWGLDYFKTLPSTNGTILNDGPNGYDNDGDNVWIAYNDYDDDNDGRADADENIMCDDGTLPGRRDGKPWKCGEGIDEADEFIDPESNEYGFYYQTKTELFGTSRFELITAARWDNHDLLDEGIQFAPKLGFIYKPDEKSTFRLTYGKAFNTPNSISLYTDLHVRKSGILDVYLRGNKDGTPYCRVGQACSGSEIVNSVAPGYYYVDASGDSIFHLISSLDENYFTGDDQTAPYSERVNGAPYFFNLTDGSAPNDMIPLDTSRYLIYVPELNGDGVLYTPEESFNIPDIDPIKTEKIQTIELGYKGFLGNRTHLTMDYYISYYEDFFSPPTFITPIIVLRNDPDLNWQGILPVNDFGSNAPYGTAWNGQDDDGDWDKWKEEFGWGDTQDQGEWGFVYYHNATDSTDYTIYHPSEVTVPVPGGIDFKSSDPNGNPINATFFDAVGVDEYHPTVGLAEAEMVLTGLIGAGGEQLMGPGLANSPPHLVLSPMNYGNVWMQGIDMGITQFIPEYNLIIDGNLSWYGTTEFYNELTKKNDPINAPEWKWNSSIKWDSSIGGLTLNYRHVDKFKWNDGIWAGTIGPYDIFDLHYNYMITDNLELSMSTLNLMDDRHKELIGGAEMGRQVIMRMVSTF